MFDVDDRRDDGLTGERLLIASALQLWVRDILAGAHDEGNAYRLFRRWTQADMPERWRLFCDLLGLDPWDTVVALWRRIAEQRDQPRKVNKHAEAMARRQTWQRAYRDALAAGFSDADAREWADLEVPGYETGQAA